MLVVTTTEAEETFAHPFSDRANIFSSKYIQGIVLGAMGEGWNTQLPVSRPSGLITKYRVSNVLH